MKNNSVLNKENLFSSEVDLSKSDHAKKIDELVSLSLQKVELLKELKIAIFLKDKAGFLVLSREKFHYFENRKSLNDFLYSFTMRGRDYKTYRGALNTDKTE